MFVLPEIGKYVHVKTVEKSEFLGKVVISNTEFHHLKIRGIWFPFANPADHNIDTKYIIHWYELTEDDFKKTFRELVSNNLKC